MYIPAHRHFRPRSPQINAPPSTAPPQPSSSDTQGLNLKILPPVVLAIFAFVFCAILVAIFAWKFWARIFKKGSNAADTLSTKGWSDSPVLVPHKAAQGTKWVPQLKASYPADDKSPSNLKRWSELERVATPPPSYWVAAGAPRTAAPPVPLPVVSPPEPRKPFFFSAPPTLPMSISLRPLSLTPTFGSQSRTSSVINITRQSSDAPVTPNSRSVNGLPLPRSVVVCNTFVPSLEDELWLKLDEKVRLIEEYHDGWCLVQRLGDSNVEKGVVPQFCLRETAEPASRHDSSRTVGRT